MLIDTFSLNLLLDSPAAQPYTLWRSPAKSGGKRAAPTQVGTIEHGIITPMIGSGGRGGGELVSAALLGGVRNPGLFFAPGEWDIRAGDGIRDAAGTHYEVQQAGVWGGALTMAVVSEPEGNVP